LAAAHVEDVAIEKHAGLGIVIDGRFVLVPFVLGNRAENASDAVLINEERVRAELRPHLEAVIVEVVDEVVVELKVLHVAQEGKVVVIGELARSELDVLVVRLAVLQDDLVRGRAAVLHVRPKSMARRARGCRVRDADVF
jgi:hypothetical protein